MDANINNFNTKYDTDHHLTTESNCVNIIKWSKIESNYTSTLPKSLRGLWKLKPTYYKVKKRLLTRQIQMTLSYIF